jgi:hypothetical protein
MFVCLSEAKDLVALLQGRLYHDERRAEDRARTFTAAQNGEGGALAMRSRGDVSAPMLLYQSLKSAPSLRFALFISVFERRKVESLH